MDVPLADQFLHWYVARKANIEPVQSIEELHLSAVRRLMLVLTTGMGDAILSTPVFPALRQALPHAQIHLLCRQSWLELFQGDPNLDAVIPYPGKYRRFFSTLRVLKTFRPELAIVLHGNDPDILPLAYLAGSRFIVRIPWRQTRYPFLLSNVHRPEDASTRPGIHYIENRLRILDSLGVPVAQHTPSLTVPDAVRRRVASRLANHLGENTRYWVYHARAADAYKSWPAEKARQTIHLALDELPELAVIVTGGPRDRRLTASLVGNLPSNRTLDLAGQLSIGELAACVEGADFLVAPDTGVLHIAAAVDTPAVALYAPTSAMFVGPRSSGTRHYIIQKPLTCYPCLSKRCPYEPSLCMDQIEVSQVLEGMLHLTHERAPVSR